MTNQNALTYNWVYSQRKNMFLLEIAFNVHLLKANINAFSFEPL